jgi:hypothetical protein
MKARFLVAIALAGAACGEQPAAPAAAPAVKPVERSTTQGPLKATVQVTPPSPRVGDVLRLTLIVDAEPGTEVTMPPFGEALGRFEVIGFAPREEALGKGRRHVQDYRLQASRSGRLRIPPLRVEYSNAAARPAAQAEELLTEEIPIQVESVLTAEGAGTLSAPRGDLDEVIARPWVIPLLAAGGVLVIALAIMAVRSFRRRHRAEVRRSAAEIAFARLGALEGRGLPEGRSDADPWYVELSDIVRRYLEDRFGIRAPELTTEEFLREARRLGELGELQRGLLTDFLEGCDRVKFAAHEPAADESRAALGLARRLIEETAAAPEPAVVEHQPPPGADAPVAAEVAS